MALRGKFSKRLFSAANPNLQSTIANTNPVFQPPSTAAHPKPHFNRELFTAPDSYSTGFFRRFLQRRAINNHSSPNAFPSFLTQTLPVGEKLREKLKSINDTTDKRLRLDGFIPAVTEEDGFRVGAAEVKKLVRFVQMEQIRAALRNIPAGTIRYGEFVRTCSDVCGNKEIGLEFAKALDEAGNVTVLGDVVFLRPHQVAKTMKTLLSQSIDMPNDPRREELDVLKKEKASIDKKARSIVRGELYCGFGFLALQTLGLMRLTFWELSWDVMEPICFFIASFQVALAYGFFLRTSKEPSYVGYFQRRFKVKQMKLMETHKFDLERYNELCEVFYPKYCTRCCDRNADDSLDHGEETVFGSVYINRQAAS